MADNVAITAGAGTNIKTDQLADNSHVQFVKLMDGASDGTGQIGGDATNGIDVDVTRNAALVASEARIGAVGRNYVQVLVTPTLSVGATYVANDFVGTDHTAMTFAGVARANGGSGHIVDATLFDYVVANVTAELWLFDTAPGGLANDSEAFTITDADALTCIGIIQFAQYYASALNSISNGIIPNGLLGFKCTAGVDDIYGCLVTRGAPAYTNGLVSVRIGVLED